MVTVDIVLATTNPAKQGKLLGLLDGLPLKPRPQVELGPEGEAPVEEGSSHEQNARHKAEFWSRAVGVQAIASDGGLLIPALGERWDSLFTHRFAGEDADDQARLSLLLQMMEPFRGEERRGDMGRGPGYRKGWPHRRCVASARAHRHVAGEADLRALGPGLLGLLCVAFPGVWKDL